MIHVYHGEGKGKTTAAIGLAVRAAGAGKKVLFAQFMKGNTSSEIKILRQIPEIEVLSVGKQFGFYYQMSTEDKAAIFRRHSEMLMQVKRYMEAGEADVFVLDEITYVQRYGLADRGLIEEVVRIAGESDGGAGEMLEKRGGPDRGGKAPGESGGPGRGKSIELVLTGREPDESFLAAADYITEMTLQRHPYEKGILARIGIEM